MIKKIVSLVLALIVVASMGAIALTASAADTKIYFELPESWGENHGDIYCYIWDYVEGTVLINWQSKKGKCAIEEDGRYSYDLSKIGGLESGKYYGLIFASAINQQTYDAYLGTPCYGDTLYCNGVIYENPADSSKTAQAAFWRNQNSAQYGPILQVSSIGNVVGTSMRADQSAEGMFTDFITGDNLGNARTYSGKDDQKIIDDLAVALGLSQATCEKLIKESGVEIAWEMAKSEAPKEDKPISPGATATGQEMTVVFVGVAMMIAAAGVVFFARKKVTK